MSDQVALLLPVDPQSQGWQARTGALGYSFVTRKLYVKIGGDPTDWTQISTSQSDLGVETVSGSTVDNTDPKNPIVGAGISTVHTSAPASGDGSVDLPVTVVAASDSVDGYMSAANFTKVTGNLRPNRGTDMTNTSQTLQPGTDKASEYVQPASVPLTNSRTKTLGITSVANGQMVRLVRKDTGAFNMTITNGGTNGGNFAVVIPPATANYFPAITGFYNNTDWVFIGLEYLKAE